MIYYSTSTDNISYIYIYTKDYNKPIKYTISI